MALRAGRRRSNAKQETSLSSSQYWNQCAADFDSLYTTRWNQLEDRRVSNLLAKFELPESPVVLDVGCGTGLGLRLLSEVRSTCHYHGFDISPRMIERFRATESTAESVTLAIADLRTYDWAAGTGPDLIMSIFSSISFCEQRWQSLRRITSHQHLGGKIFLMALSRFALYRILRLDLSGEGQCKTRGSTSKHSVRAFYETPRTMRRNIEDMGYRLLTLVGDGPMSGVCEAPAMWKVNEVAGKIVPALSYTIIAIGEKVRAS